MIGQLGDIIFEILKEPLSMSGGRSYSYAEHPVVASKGNDNYSGFTKLQYTGYEPAKYDLKLRFHASFCNPEEEIKDLYAHAQKRDNDGLRVSLPFFIGEIVAGDYVIVDIKEEYQKFFPDGMLIEAIVDVSVREYA